MSGVQRAPRDLGFEEVVPPEPGGIRWSMFRADVAGEDFSEADLSDAQILRSLVEDTAFRRIVGRNIVLTWNDFNRCDFQDADLRGVDLRCSILRDCRFENADLSGVDLRRTALHRCGFKGARMKGTRLTHWQKLWLRLDSDQKASVVCTWRGGDIPPGG